jgi:hypothetical protein
VAEAFRPDNRCDGCGTKFPDDTPTTANCRNCPPTPCEDCGGVNVWETGDLCSCWISLDALPLADVKAVFASDCSPECGPELSIDPAVNHGE